MSAGKIAKCCSIAGKKKHGSPGRPHRKNRKHGTNNGKKLK